MRRSSFGFLFAFATAAPVVVAQVPVDRATNLARKWTTGADSPVCQLRGGRGEYLSPGTRYCRWPSSPGTELSVTVQTKLGLSLVTWDRYATNATDATRITDSVGRSLVAQGLKAQVCKPSDMPAGHTTGTLWSDAGLAVYLTRIDSKSGAPHVVIMATNVPQTMQPLGRLGSCGGMAAPPAGAKGDVPVNRATDLARKWATTGDKPKCGVLGPKGEKLVGETRYCTWPAPPGTVLSAKVHANGAGVSLITWDRHAASASDAGRIVDSLGRALVALGLKAKVCESMNTPTRHVAATLWSGDDLAVYLARNDSRDDSNDTTPHLVVFATDMPIALQAACGAPGGLSRGT